MKLSIISIVIYFLLLTSYLPFLSGCKKESVSPQTKGAQTERKEIQTQLIPQEIPGPEEQGYIYNSKGRRDPFTSLIAVTKEKEKKGRVAGTLEGYDIGDFKLIATAQKEGQYYGLLLAPDNKSYTVREGTTLGLHKGKVKKIANDKVIIIEYIKDYKGKLTRREIVLELRKGKEGE